MAKKKQFHGIHITPKAGTHYEVRHDPKHEGGGMAPMMGDSEENSKLFAHGERERLHKHIDKLMDAHEGVKDSPEEERSEHEVPPQMNKLKARRYS